MAARIEIFEMGRENEVAILRFDPNEAEKMAEALRRQNPDCVYECLTEREGAHASFPFRGMTAMYVGPLPALEVQRDAMYHNVEIARRAVVLCSCALAVAAALFALGHYFRGGPVDVLGGLFVIVLACALGFLALMRRFLTKNLLAIDSVIERAKKRRAWAGRAA